MSGWCDSDKNIIAELRHESCHAHCDECGECLHVDDDFETSTDDSGATEFYFCMDCV